MVQRLMKYCNSEMLFINDNLQTCVCVCVYVCVCVRVRVCCVSLLEQVRKRSKACRAGLREGDELVSINEQACGALSHAQAMNLIDSSPGLLHVRVKRSTIYCIKYGV